MRTWQQPSAQTILFYPNLPDPISVIYQLCLCLGCRVTTDPQDAFDVCFKWEDQTFSPNDAVLLRLQQQGIPVINLKCEDISKAYVMEVFQAVFHYGLEVNPLTYAGPCVVKSNLNAMHDGYIIEAPIETRAPNAVYSRLISNQTGDQRVLDLRVPIFKDFIPLVILKERSIAQRFANFSSVLAVRLSAVQDVFSEQEVCKILEFCHRIGLDYGELDILRDSADGRIYIVDANNTPYGRMLYEPLKKPQNQCILSAQERQFLLSAFVQAFQRQLLRQGPLKTEVEVRPGLLEYLLGGQLND